MRGSAGDQIVVFNGQGGEYLARVDQVRRAEILLTLLERREIDRQPRLRVTLGAALPKGDRQRWLIEKAVELGAERFIPLQTRRSVGHGAEEAAQKLRRAAIEAAKQCGGNRLLAIKPRVDWSAWLAAAPQHAARWIAHPGSASRAASEFLHDCARAEEAWLAIGPEGGFTDEEVEAGVAQGWKLVSLGPRLLRVETAALALLATALLAPHSEAS
jgi:16S rRNA (uracil1498-N3)-methyltransferase